MVAMFGSDLSEGFGSPPDRPAIAQRSPSCAQVRGATRGGARGGATRRGAVATVVVVVLESGRC